MKIPAKQFKHCPMMAYMTAYKGGEVIITNNRYPVDFKLIAVDKQDNEAIKPKAGTRNE